jgi:predicted alpha/beta superfamily hydrolase
MQLKKLYLLINIPLLCTQSIFSQETRDIVIGQATTITSKVLDSEREILIYLPASYGENNYNFYPVIYLLDGKKFFHSFSGVVAQLSSDASPQIPESIIVGITSQDRAKDSSPTKSKIGLFGKEEQYFESSGGANDFLKFINDELIPFIDSKYRTNSYRTFVGYSFTGLAIMHALFTTPKTFNSYLAIDFSAWWDNEVTLKNAKIFFNKKLTGNKDIFIATVDRVVIDYYPSEYNRTWNFIQAFEQNHQENISFGYKKYDYKSENHHSMPLISFIDGLKYIYRGYMINYDEMYEHPYSLKDKYNKISERLGVKVCLREDLGNHFGYKFLYDNPDIEKAMFYFKYNTENYPKSANAWDSLAEAYYVNGNETKALEYFEKALDLDPNNSAIKKKVEKLKE